jgi:LDH2 family malate/lactate/ureidoglycolate dehydrogenase
MALKNFSRNSPPEHGIRVPAEAMRQLVATLWQSADLPAQDAELLADILVRCDLRCVFSHGTRQLASYLPLIKEGKINPRPQIRVVQESATSLVLDGDGGMGYLPCWRGAEQILEKVAEHGMAALTTRHHFHFGSAGNYSRQGLERGCIGIASSSNRFAFDPENSITGICGASPLSIAVPAGDQPPLVLDMGTPQPPKPYENHPGLVFKTLGLNAVVQVLGAILPGIYKPECQEPQSPWLANQGGFVAFFDVGRFMPQEDFKKEMDHFVGQARAMQPLPGMDRTELAGGMEWAWDQENRRDGIPVEADHRKLLEGVAAEWGVETPFEDYEHTQF